MHPDVAVRELTPEQRKRYKAIDEDFWKLYNECKEEGLFKPSPSHIALRILELVFSFVAMSLCYKWLQAAQLSYPLHFILTGMLAVIGGIFAGRCGFLAHETGHNSLTGSTKADNYIAKIVMGMHGRFR